MPTTSYCSQTAVVAVRQKGAWRGRLWQVLKKRDYTVEAKQCNKQKWAWHPSNYVLIMDGTCDLSYIAVFILSNGRLLTLSLSKRLSKILFSFFDRGFVV